MTHCIFCQIASGNRDAHRIAENSSAMAFLDISPVNRGHTLVIPRRHVPSFLHLSGEETGAMFQLVQRIGQQLKASIPGCEGITLSAADGEAAGQEVFHTHLHIIPRFREDGFGWRRYGTATGADLLAETASQIRSGDPAS